MIAPSDFTLRIGVVRLPAESPGSWEHLYRCEIVAGGAPALDGNDGAVVWRGRCRRNLSPRMIRAARRRLARMQRAVA